MLQLLLVLKFLLRSLIITSIHISLATVRHMDKPDVSERESKIFPERRYHKKGL